MTCIGCFFSLLQPDCHRELKAIQKFKTFKKGQLIHELHRNSNSLFLMRSGIAKAQASGSRGGQYTLMLFGPGDLIGTENIFLKAPQTTEVISCTDSLVCEFPLPGFLKILTANAELLYSLTRRCAEKQSEILGRFLCQMESRAHSLVATALLAFHRLNADYIATRKDLAEWANLRTETVIRILGELEKSGCLRRKGRGFQIANVEALRKLADPGDVLISA